MRTPEQWRGLDRLEHLEEMLADFCEENTLFWDCQQDADTRSLRVEVADYTASRKLVMYIPLDDVRHYPYTDIFIGRIRRAWKGVKRG